MPSTAATAENAQQLPASRHNFKDKNIISALRHNFLHQMMLLKKKKRKSKCAMPLFLFVFFLGAFFFFFFLKVPHLLFRLQNQYDQVAELGGRLS